MNEETKFAATAGFFGALTIIVSLWMLTSCEIKKYELYLDDARVRQVPTSQVVGPVTPF